MLDVSKRNTCANNVPIAACSHSAWIDSITSWVGNTCCYLEPFSRELDTRWFVVYALHAHLNNLWTDTCALLLLGVACAFGTVSHVQQSVSSVRTAKHALKEFEEVSEVSTPHRRQRCGCFSRRPRVSLLLLLSFLLMDLAVDFTVYSGCILALCFASIFAPVFQLFLALTTNSMSRQWDC